MRKIIRLPLVTCLALLAPLPAVSEGETSREDSGTECYRPAMPEPEYYESKDAYLSARETFYRDASLYLDCVNRWAEEIRLSYQEMFQAEVEAFKLEREAVFEDLRRAARTEHIGSKKSVRQEE